MIILLNRSSATLPVPSAPFVLRRLRLVHPSMTVEHWCGKYTMLSVFISGLRTSHVDT